MPRQEAVAMLTVEGPSPEVSKQLSCLTYIVRSVLDGPNANNKSNPERFCLLVHGPGGCGKSVVTRAAAHLLREANKGVVLAAPTGVAAFNVNGATLHSCLLLPVVNQSYGKACDVPLPRGGQLACLRSFWKYVDVALVDEMSFISSEMLDRMDRHLRMTRDAPLIPFGGVHLALIGDLYQLPPPAGAELDLQSKQRAAAKASAITETDVARRSSHIRFSVLGAL